MVLRAADRVFSKRVADKMANYTLMYYNILWPIGVQFMTILVSGCWVLYHRYRLHDRRYGWSFFLPGASIATVAGTSYPQWRLALFSFWDQLNAAVTGIPSPYISQNDRADPRESNPSRAACIYAACTCTPPRCALTPSSPCR